MTKPHDELLAAAKRVLTGLNARIEAADKSAVPVFDGIAELHDAINRASRPAHPQAGEVEPFMYAYECVDDGRWQAYRQQLKRADGSICPGKPLYAHPQPHAEDDAELREGIARVIEPMVWRRFDRQRPYADHVSREQQIAWWEPLKRSLAKADSILKLISAARRDDHGGEAR